MDYIIMYFEDIMCVRIVAEEIILQITIYTRLQVSLLLVHDRCLCIKYHWASD